MAIFPPLTLDLRPKSRFWPQKTHFPMGFRWEMAIKMAPKIGVKNGHFLANSASKLAKIWSIYIF